EDPRVVALVKDFYQRSCFVTAICAAPTVLHKAGITSGIAITSYPSEASVFKEARYLEKPVVRSGRIITGRGVGTAIPFALTLVRAWKGEAAARKLAGAILFDQPF
ncbi:MAG: DJ-1 family protein, partial [Calditrichaeota bacterium]